MDFIKLISSLFTNYFSRRNFIKAASVSITTLFYKCADDPVQPKSENEPIPLPELTAKISGPKNIRLPVDEPVTIQLDGSESGPKESITDILWRRKEKKDEEYKEIGSEEIIEDTIDTKGDYEYLLKVELKNVNDYVFSEAKHNLEVYPPLLAKIIGTKSEQYLESGVNIQLDGSKSIGEITELTWSKKNQQDEYLIIASGDELNDTLTNSGLHRYRLEVKDPYGISEATHDVSIIGDSPFSNAIFFLKSPIANVGPRIISKMDPESFAIEEIFIHDQYTLAARSLSKEPNGSRLVFGMLDSDGQNLYTYNLETKNLERIQTTTGISWRTSWNPFKNWIAYVEDGRYPARDKDELTLVNPDTKEVIYLAGDQTDKEDKYVGLGPSWDPTGEKIALGNTRYYYEDGNKQYRRISIYSDIFSGSPKRERLHSEAYMKSYFGSWSSDINEGRDSVSWSPDNTLIAYNIGGGQYGILGNSYILNAGSLAIANADGSGIITILTDVLAQNISWSPDSQHIVFSRIISGSAIRHLCMVDRNGGNYIDINEQIGKSNESYSQPVWAG